MPTTLQPTSRLSLKNIIMAGMMLIASPAHGMVYMWRDSAGIAHYTNKEYDVPARYKAKIKVLYPETSDIGTTQSGTANIQAAPVAQQPAAASQNAGPGIQPVTRSAAPVTQTQSTPSKPPERRSRRHRERNSDEDE